MAAVLAVSRIGARGDGIADTPEGPVHIPGALPGERVLIEDEGERARLIEVIEASAERARPPCAHFGACGGCAAQHMASKLYASWKLSLLESPLARVGLSTEIRPLRVVPPGARRRVVLALARGTNGQAVLGFHGARSHAVVGVETCPVADPAIMRALPTLRALLAPLAPKAGAIDVCVLASPAGLDVALDASIAPSRRQGLIAAAGAAGLARISARGEVLAAFRPPKIDVGGIGLVPPPGGFVQASAEAEDALAADVLGIIGKARRVADLFAGSGAFALRLARRAPTHAVEGSASALAALDAARRGVPGLKPITWEKRDLFRRPLQGRELDAFDAVVLDPPRQGAEAQILALAASKVRAIAYVSCNPVSFARDAARLVAAGFRLDHVLPVDQFLWSRHLETSAAFRR